MFFHYVVLAPQSMEDTKVKQEKSERTKKDSKVKGPKEPKAKAKVAKTDQRKKKDSSEKVDGSQGVTKYGDAKRKFTAEPLSLNSWMFVCVCVAHVLFCFRLDSELFLNWVDTLALIHIPLPLKEQQLHPRCKLRDSKMTRKTIEGLWRESEERAEILSTMSKAESKRRRYE